MRIINMLHARIYTCMTRPSELAAPLTPPPLSSGSCSTLIKNQGPNIAKLGSSMCWCLCSARRYGRQQRSFLVAVRPLASRGLVGGGRSVCSPVGSACRGPGTARCLNDGPRASPHGRRELVVRCRAAMRAEAGRR